MFLPLIEKQRQILLKIECVILTRAADSKSRGARSKGSPSIILALDLGEADTLRVAGRIAGRVGEANHLEDVEHCKKIGKVLLLHS